MLKLLKICFHNWAVRVYRFCVFPLRKAKLMFADKVMFGIGGYADSATQFGGNNYVGQEAFLSNCKLGKGSYVGDGSRICNLDAGKFCSIGFGVTTAIGKHPIRENISTSPSMFSVNPANNFSLTNKQLFEESTPNVVLGNDVWIGNNVVLLGGVTVGDGAIIGAGSVVTKSVKEYGIYVGCPAKCVGRRFDDNIIEELEKLEWWNKDEKWLREHSEYFADPSSFFDKLN